jgi:hypothetical protein
MSRKALFEANRPFANGYMRGEAADTRAISIVNQLADHLGFRQLKIQARPFRRAWRLSRTEVGALRSTCWTHLGTRGLGS